MRIFKFYFHDYFYDKIRNISDHVQTYKSFVVYLMDFTLSIPRIISEAFSAIMIVGAFVFPDGIFRMTEASTTRRFFIFLTLTQKKEMIIMI